MWFLWFAGCSIFLVLGVSPTDFALSVLQGKVVLSHRARVALCQVSAARPVAIFTLYVNYGNLVAVVSRQRLVGEIGRAQNISLSSIFSALNLPFVKCK